MRLVYMTCSIDIFFCLKITSGLIEILLQRNPFCLIDCKVKALLCWKISTPLGSILQSKPCIDVLKHLIKQYNFLISPEVV